ncbi:MAG: BON domain-containing protein [Acidobacteriota bacterium]
MKRLLLVIATLLLSLLASCGTTASSADATLQGSIVAVLHGDHLDDVRVMVHNRRVVLDGTVGSQEERDQAQSDAERVDGVLAVRNNLKIVPHT